MSSTGAEATKVGSPLFRLLYEINQAASHGMPLLAIAMTVALPDICVSLKSADGRTSPQKYKDWCTANLGSEFKYLTAEDLYSMRCGVLHNGRFGDMKHSVARVLFALPGIGSFVNCRVDDAYLYSVEEFCKNFTIAVQRWFVANEDDEVIKANIPRMMQYRTELRPYFSGGPFLA